MAAVITRVGKGRAGGRLGTLCGGVPCLIPNSSGEIVTALQRPEKQTRRVRHVGDLGPSVGREGHRDDDTALHASSSYSTLPPFS